MNKWLLILFLVSTSFSQSLDTNITLKKPEYIGVIKGIKYLEAKDSITSSLISNFDSQVDNYKKLREQDSIKFHYTSKMLKEAVEYKDIAEKNLYKCENPPFYNTTIAFLLYGMISVILIGIIF